MGWSAITKNKTNSDMNMLHTPKNNYTILFIDNLEQNMTKIGFKN